jgi:phosphonate transport system ATP-binding protein
MESAVRVTNLQKTFRGHRALAGVSFDVRPGEMVALIGASGSGKSTLLRHIAGLVASDDNGDGAIAVNGQTIQSRGRLASDIRDQRSGIGFVFQQFNLVDRLSVETNVLAGLLARVPLWRSLPKWFTPEERRLALNSLCRVGIEQCCNQRASTLSGGQQQRAAIARALVQKASIILADEPIASLDPESSRRVMEMLATVNREDGITVLVSLHQVGYAMNYCRRVIALKDGLIVYDGPSAALSADLLAEIYGAELDDLALDIPARPSFHPTRMPGMPPMPQPAFAGAGA